MPRATRVRRNHALLPALAAVAAVAVAATGCGGHDRAKGGHPPRPGTARANAHVGAPGATLRVVSPARGATVRGPVVVQVVVRGFRLDARHLDQAPRKGRGHLQFRLDGGRFDRARYSGASGRLAARLGVAGRFSPAVRPTITYQRIPAGRHTLVVSLANNDLSETGVRARTVFMVR